jgi:Domain of unknown function (DUF6457)
VTRDEWIAEFAGKLGVEPPSPREVAIILDLAGVAAHGSERTAAPVACWIGGQTGTSAEALRDVARTINADGDA